MKFLKKYWPYVALGCLSLIPIIWFLGKGNVLINGLDTNFPLDPLIWLKRRFFVWNPLVNAGVDFSSSISGLFFHLVQTIPYLLGFSLRNVEIISIVFWFSAIVVSSFILSKRIFPESKLSQLTCVFLYSLNIYLFNTWENIKVSNLSLYVALPIFIYILYSLIEGTIDYKKTFLYFVLISVLVSGAGINPAYFSVIVLTIIVFTLLMLLLKRGQSRKIIYSGVIALASLIAVNLFWIFPLSSFLLGKNISGLNDLGFTNWLDSLSRDTSLVNVIRLQGAWDWYALDKYGMPQYLPYTLNYLYKLPFIVFSFIPPVLAIFSLAFFKKEKKDWYILFGTLMILGIFLGAGSHPPTGAFYVFLSKHLPFFSFFRSPWYIFTPLLTLSYAALAGLLIDRVETLLKNKLLLVFKIIVFGFLLSYAIYNYPLITGKIFRPGRNDSFYVKFPSYVYETRDWLKGKVGDDNARIITYPDDQLESFKWGYQATESILGLFSNKEIITPSFNLQSKVFDALLTQFYNHLKKGEYQSAINMFGLFGTNELFIKNDASTLAPLIGKTIKKLGDIKEIGSWMFLDVENKYGKIFSPTKTYSDLSNSNSFVGVASLLEKGAVSLNGASDSVVGKLKNYDGFSSIQEAAQVDPLLNIGSNTKTYFVETIKEGRFKLVLERKFLGVGNLRVKIDNSYISSNSISNNDSFIVITSQFMTKGKHYIEVDYPENLNNIEVKNYKELTSVPGLKTSELPDSLVTTLVAFSQENKEKDIIIPVPNFNPYLKYLVEMNYKYFYGSVPIIDVIQSAPTSPIKAFTEYLGGSVDWEHRQFVVDPVYTESKLEVFIRLPANKYGGRSKTFIENISVKRIYDNRLFIIEDETLEGKVSVPQIKIVKSSPVKYVISVKDTEGPYILAFLDNYSKNWSIKRTKGGETGDTPHFTVNGYANGWYIPEGATEQELTLYYRPQNLYLMGSVFSVAVLIASIVINLVARRKKK